MLWLALKELPINFAIFAKNSQSLGVKIWWEKIDLELEKIPSIKFRYKIQNKNGGLRF